jgi:predicted nucleotidyltransferase
MFNWFKKKEEVPVTQEMINELKKQELKEKFEIVKYWVEKDVKKKVNKKVFEGRIVIGDEDRDNWIKEYKDELIDYLKNQFADIKITFTLGYEMAPGRMLNTRILYWKV